MLTWIVYILSLLLFAVLYIKFMSFRDRKRLSTLRKDKDGYFVWTEWHGGSRRSKKDPRKNGGDWGGSTGGEYGGGDGGGCD